MVQDPKMRNILLRDGREWPIPQRVICASPPPAHPVISRYDRRFRQVLVRVAKL